ncbi:MAG: spore germination protein [Clostridiales bacterium]|jgi:spore germination protein|nr:spore germination protein [Clostridiales bacterium]
MLKTEGFALNNRISLRQMQALLFLEIFGFGITALPRRVAEAAAQDGWIGVLLAVGVTLGLVWIIVHVGKKYTDSTFYDFVCKLLTKPVGILVCLFLCLRLLLLASFNLRIFAEITQTMLLPTTPPLIIFAAMLALAAYGASKGIEARGRMAEILIIIVLLPLILVFGLSAREIEFANLLPIFAANPAQLGSAGFSALFAFNGLDMLLLIMPFLARPKNAAKSAFGVVATMGGLMVVITAATIARFGPENIVHHIWPVLKMMDTAAISGGIIDRQGALMMTFWIISAYAIINASLFFSSLLLKDVLRRGKHIHYILACVPIIAILANLPENLAEVYNYFEVYNRTIALAAMVFLPLLLLVFSKIRGFKNAQ